MDDATRWERAIDDLADLLDLVEDAIERDDWNGAVGVRLAVDPVALPPVPDAATADRARAVLAEANRLDEVVRVRRDAVRAELSTGGERRHAAARYGATTRLS